MIIDSHVHLWKFNPVKDAWITDEMNVIKRDFLAEDIQTVLAENQIDGCIAVQADQSENENLFLIQEAKRNNFIKGIVGWVDLRSDQVEERLEHFSKEPLIKGIRHIVQAEPYGFLANEKFLNGASLLHNYDFTYDVLVYHHQLKDAIPFVHHFQGQTFIIDHCAKPNIREKEIKNWKSCLKEMAQHKNLYCKVSGLLTEAHRKEWQADDIKPYLDAVFEIFSTDRIIYGSDWPVLLLAGKYSEWLNLLKDYLKGFPTKDQENVFSLNALRAYRIEQ